MNLLMLSVYLIIISYVQMNLRDSCGCPDQRGVHFSVVSVLRLTGSIRLESGDLVACIFLPYNSRCIAIGTLNTKKGLHNYYLDLSFL